MVFGTTRFRCNECGNRFVSTAMEWCATAFLTPIDNLGRFFYPRKLLEHTKSIYQQFTNRFCFFK